MQEPLCSTTDTVFSGVQHFSWPLTFTDFWPKKCQFVMVVSAIEFARPILEHCTGILSDELSLIKLFNSGDQNTGHKILFAILDCKTELT